MSIARRIATVVAGTLCAIMVLAFISAKTASANPLGEVQQLAGALTTLLLLVAFTAAVAWALRPIFSKPDGLRVPPLAFSVFGVLIVMVPVNLFVWFWLYLAFGGSK